MISHGTAANHWGLTDRQPVSIDVTVPVEAGRKLDGIRCRRCRYPLPEEICEHRGVVCTTPARTLIDEAGHLGASSVRDLVERAAVRKLLDLDACYRAIAAAKGRRGTRLLTAILSDWDVRHDSVADVRSVFEARVLPRLVALDLPRPLCNQPLMIDGETLIPDFLWPDHRLIVETDGRETHETAAAFQRDRRRDQLFTAAGYRTSRVTWIQMRDDEAGVVSRIARALGQVPPSTAVSVSWGFGRRPGGACDS